MKKIFIAAMLMTSMAVPTMAQSGAVKKAAKSVVKISAFQADGKLVHTGYGVIVDESGTALTAWTPYVDAAYAVAIDGKGKKYDVEYIYGASEMYNVAKVRLTNSEDSSKKSEFDAVQIEEGQQSVGGEAWVVGYDIKSPMMKKVSPSKIETFSTSLPYYIFEQETAVITEDMSGYPVLNAQGKLMGLVSTSTLRTDFYAASAKYAMTLTPTAFSVNDNVLRYTGLRIALPSDYNQAVVALLMSARGTVKRYEGTIEDFIQHFPNKSDGYITKTEWRAMNADYQGADAAIQQALQNAEDKDNIHYAYSRTIYNTLLEKTDTLPTPWTLDKAVEEVNAAIAIKDQPLYHVHKGKVLFSQQKFQEAKTQFETANNMPGYRDAEVYYYVYQCMKNLKAKRAELIVPLDSATAINPDVMTYQAEKLLLLIRMNRAADAVTVGQLIVDKAPQYAEGHGLLGLALCYAKRKDEGVAELEKARSLGYAKADEYIKLFANK